MRPAVSGFFAVSLTAAFAFAAPATATTLCVVVDGEPAVLAENRAVEIETGLCEGAQATRLAGERQKELAQVVLFSLASGNPATIAKALEVHEAGRIVYSVHSEADGLVTHSVYLHDGGIGATVTGGRTFDSPGKIKNATGAWAKASAAFALDELAARDIAGTLVAAADVFGAQAAQMLAQPSAPAQFLRPRGVYDPAQIDAARRVIDEAEKTSTRRAVNFARAVTAYLEGKDGEAIRAFDAYAKDGPRPHVEIARVNLLIALGRYDEALAAADAADKALGFSLFSLSHALALRGLGRDTQSREAFLAFRRRSGADWLEMTHPLVDAAFASGDANLMRVYGETYLSGDPPAEERARVEALIKARAARAAHVPPSRTPTDSPGN
ncbi:hypothetical protein K8I61_16035 [bacterium]|nr:hypothetical protein [bacterium]